MSKKDRIVQASLRDANPLANQTSWVDHKPWVKTHGYHHGVAPRPQFVVAEPSSPVTGHSVAERRLMVAGCFNARLRCFNARVAVTPV